jgi:predicted DNA-binding transcriptional regulator AlpA
MKLFSIMQMPKKVPAWDTMLADLGHPKPELVARALGVSRSTAYRWQSGENPPRTAQLAVFWLTRWGRSAIAAQATNDALMALSLSKSLAEQLGAFRAQPARPGEGLGPASAKKRRGKTLDFCVVGTKTSPPTQLPARTRVARTVPKNPRKG